MPYSTSKKSAFIPYLPSGSLSTTPYTQVDESASSLKRKKPLSLMTSLTPYTHVKQTYVNCVTTSTSPDGKVSSGPGYYQAGRYNLPDSFTQSLIDTSVSRLRKKLKDEKWNSSVFIAEMPKTVKFIKETASEIFNLYQDVKKGRMSDVYRRARRFKNSALYKRDFAYLQEMLRKSTREVSERWLAWRYAVCPLMYDLDDALKALNASRLRANYDRKVAGKSDTHQETIKIDKYRNRQWQCSVTTRATIIYQMNTNVVQWQQLGLLNPVAMLWELTPFSFVVDWFIPVGNYVANLDAMIGVTPISRSLSHRRRGTCVKNGCSYGGANKTTSYSEGEASYLLDEYTRDTSFSLSEPAPRIAISLNSSRLLDSLALLRTSIKH